MVPEKKNATRDLKEKKEDIIRMLSPHMKNAFLNNGIRYQKRESSTQWSYTKDIREKDIGIKKQRNNSSKMSKYIGKI